MMMKTMIEREMMALRTVVLFKLNRFLEWGRLSSPIFKVDGFTGGGGRREEGCGG